MNSEGRLDLGFLRPLVRPYIAEHEPRLPQVFHGPLFVDKTPCVRSTCSCGWRGPVIVLAKLDICLSKVLAKHWGEHMRAAWQTISN